MTRILLAAVFLMVLLAGAALTPKPSEATGTHAILTVDRAVTGGRGYRAGSGSGDSLTPDSWTLNTDTGTVTATVTDFYWSSTTIYFTIDQCLFEDGKDLTGLMIGAIPIPVRPAHRQDCYSYQVPYDNTFHPPAYLWDIPTFLNGDQLNVEIFWPNARYDTRLDQQVKLAAPTNVALSSPALRGDAYEVELQWTYAGSTNQRHNWYEVEWNGQIYVADLDLVEFAAFANPGPVTARVRLAGACSEVGSGGSCQPGAPRRGVVLGQWSSVQSVLIPVADTQYPTGAVEAEAPAAVVDALVGVSDAFGQPLSEARAHLWSIFICLLLAIGLAAVCVGATGGGPASIFLGALAFFLVFSLAGPTAFGVPGVFAGLALLVPGLGLALYAKGKVR